jgi:hypothetical protein
MEMTHPVRASRRFLPLLFWAAVLVAVVMATLPHPPQLLDNIGDKYQHMAAFAVLAIFAGIAYPKTPLMRIGERLSFLGALIELVQSIPALNRDCDILDWVADTGAIIAALLIVSWIRGLRRRRAHSVAARLETGGGIA